MDDLYNLEHEITKELKALIQNGNLEGTYLGDDIQPPSSIILAAAVAAAKVFMAFEHGYQMDSEAE